MAENRALIEKGLVLANSVLRWESGHIVEGHAREFMRLYNEFAPLVPDAHYSIPHRCPEDCPSFTR